MGEFESSPSTEALQSGWAGLQLIVEIWEGSDRNGTAVSLTTKAYKDDKFLEALHLGPADDSEVHGVMRC